MSLTTRLNDDSLLYLFKFLNPSDQFNLVLSGVLKGFENVIHSQRSKGILIELKYRSQKIIIRSLKCSKFNTINQNILENVSKAGHFANVRKLHLDFLNTSIENPHWNTLTLEDLARVFHFCPKLTDLTIQIDVSMHNIGMSQIHADLASELRQGFRRLEQLKLDDCLKYLFLNSWPIYQEILTWCSECKELSVREIFVPVYELHSPITTPVYYFKLDSSLVPTNTNFGQKLQKIDLYSDSDELLKWLLPYCRNLHTLIEYLPDALPDVGIGEFLQMKNLKNLSITISRPNQLTEILRNCLHLESLDVNFLFMDEEGLVDVLMEPADNILDLKLTCRPQPYGNVMMGMNGSIGEILPVFKKWQHLRRLGLFGEGWVDAACPVLNLVCHFILDMKSLTYLYISDVGFKSNEIITLKREVDDWVKLRRPGFSFKISNYRLSDDSWYPFIF